MMQKHHRVFKNTVLANFCGQISGHGVRAQTVVAGEEIEFPHNDMKTKGGNCQNHLSKKRNCSQSTPLDTHMNNVASSGVEAVISVSHHSKRSVRTAHKLIRCDAMLKSHILHTSLQILIE